MPPLKLTRLRCYAFLNEVYGNKPQPNWKKYTIENLRKSVRMWYEWNGEAWVLNQLANEVVV